MSLYFQNTILYIKNSRFIFRLLLRIAVDINKYSSWFLKEYIAIVECKESLVTHSNSKI